MMIIQDVHFVLTNFNNRSPVSRVTLLAIILAKSHLYELDSNMFNLKSFKFSLIFSFILRYKSFQKMKKIHQL